MPWWEPADTIRECVVAVRHLLTEVQNTNSKVDKLMTSSNETQSKIDALTTQVQDVDSAVKTGIESLKNEIASLQGGGVDTSKLEAAVNQLQSDVAGSVDAASAPDAPAAPVDAPVGDAPTV